MHASIEYYHKPTRIILSLIGLWPYQCPYVARIQKLLCLILFSSHILVQLLVFVTTQYTINLLMKILAFVFPLSFLMVKYCFCLIEADRIKQMMREMQNDWFALRDKREIVIIHQYARFGRLVSLTLIACSYFSILCVGICQFLPLILDIVLPLNESRPIRLIITTEYFVSQEKYCYVMLLHVSLVILIALNVFCGVSSILMIGILHACMLYKIARYRMRNALEENAIEASSPESKSFSCKKMIHAIVSHQRANEFLKLIESLCGISYTILVSMGVMSLTVSLVHFLQEILDGNNTEASIIGLSVITQFLYMFIANFCGQQIIDHGESLFKASCSGMWYALPLHTQKLLLFVTQKTVLNVTMTLGGIFVVSLECFSTLASTAVSYFTVFYSTRY